MYKQSDALQKANQKMFDQFNKCDKFFNLHTTGKITRGSL